MRGSRYIQRVRSLLAVCLAVPLALASGAAQGDGYGAIAQRHAVVVHARYEVAVAGEPETTVEDATRSEEVAITSPVRPARPASSRISTFVPSVVRTPSTLLRVRLKQPDDPDPA